MTGLGRRTPSDWRHVERWPTIAETFLAAPVPVAIGINWYTAFDEPERIGGHWWIGRSGNLGSVRGGHCVCLKARGQTDPTGWWDFYNQGSEGSCVGFGCSRMMSELNRKRYFARWLWDRAKATDEWQDTNPGDDEGTSVRAALAILKAEGHVPWTPAYAPLDASGDYINRDQLTGMPAEGISAYRWARSVDDALELLGYQDVGYVDILNSWGRAGYPHLVRMPAETLDRLLREDGEVGLVTDR